MRFLQGLFGHFEKLYLNFLNLFINADGQTNLQVKLFFIVCTTPTDGLAPNGARSFADVVLT